MHGQIVNPFVCGAPFARRDVAPGLPTLFLPAKWLKESSNAATAIDVTGTSGRFSANIAPNRLSMKPRIWGLPMTFFVSL
jgi:hypothetical protein